MADWNPNMYLKFGRERTQPAIDLLSQIEIEAPRRIIDIGCGPGNSTILLKYRWPDADITGIDLSQAMIEQAKKDYPDIRFITGDAGGDLSHLGWFDVLFANASLQWIPDHPHLIPRLFGMVNPGGVFAAQIPQFDRMPIACTLHDTASSPKWKGYFADLKPGYLFCPDESYYDLLCRESSGIDLWTTDYYHVMDNHNRIIEMMRSTGIKPYLDRLTPEQGAEFCGDILEGLKNDYPVRADNKVLYPFKRFFVIAKHV